MQKYPIGVLIKWVKNCWRRLWSPTVTPPALSNQAERAALGDRANVALVVTPLALSSQAEQVPATLNQAEVTKRAGLRFSGLSSTVIWETELTLSRFDTWQVIWVAEQAMWATFSRHYATLPLVVQEAVKRWEAAKQVAKAECAEETKALIWVWDPGSRQGIMGLCWASYSAHLSAEAAKEAARAAETDMWASLSQHYLLLPLPMQQAWAAREQAWAMPHVQSASPWPAPSSLLDSPLLTATPDQQPTSLFPDPFTLEMVLIPAGEFIMGSDRSVDPCAQVEENPQHRVDLAAYTISRYPITNGQYSAFIEATGDHPPEHWPDGKLPLAKIDHPVVNVNWYDTQKYCDWLSQIHHRIYRLPTEAEWEKAARSTDGRIYAWGNQAPNAQLANYGRKIARTTPVGSYPPGAHGLYDMAGNVWEWTADWYHENYYARSPASNPKGPVGGSFRIVRGGSFTNYAHNIRCATRRDVSPYFRFPNFGFRVVSPDF